MPHKLPTIRRSTVTRVTMLECAVCTNGWYFDGFPDWTLPRTLWCPWCGTGQTYPADKSTSFCENDVDNLMGIINESSMTTERDRELFKVRLQTFLDLHLQAAPREQLESIEREMLRYRPTADHRK